MNRLVFLVATFCAAMFTLGIYSCAKDDVKNRKNTNSKIEFRKCPTCKTGWAGVRSDVWGGINGAGTGAWLTGGNPIGIMLGGVVGTVGSSAGWWRIISEADDIVPFPFTYAPDNANSIQNPLDRFGKIHNKILSEVTSDSTLVKDNYYYIFNRSLELLQQETELFKSSSIDLVKFKMDFEPSFTRLYANDFSYNPIFEQLNNRLVLSLKNSEITTNEEFEQFISKEISMANSTEELFALAIMRHTFYFWQPLEN